MAVLQILSFTVSVSADGITETSQTAAVTLENGQISEKTVTVPSDGEYELSVVFRTIDDSAQLIEYAVKIDANFLTVFSE